ncbi:MAG: hypothetical protein NUV84_01840 [Candidatus Uhrbacteria bacterium]|nr:hypothetical protein [Candidatus Uhrbacteria bacterium]
MTQFLKQIKQAAFKRAFEVATQPLIEEALRTHLDPNTAARRILRSILTIPGFNLASNVLFSAGGELLAEHADELWPGDTRPYTVAMRQILKQVGPLIVGGADATADALEIVGNEAVDRVTNPATMPPAERRGTMDGLFFFYHEGSWRLILPLRIQDGSVQMDEWGNPVPTNPEVLGDYNHDDYTKSTTRNEKSGRDGKSTRQVKGPPAKRRMVVGPVTPLEAAEKGLFSLKRFPLEEAEAIKKLLRPKPSWESEISPDVDRVLSWLIRVLSLAALNITALERQEIEDLVGNMMKQKPEPEWVNRRLGRFSKETDKFPLDGRRTYNDAQLGRIRALLGCIRDELDITLGGEQSLATKARKGLQAAPDILRQVWKVFSGSAPWATAIRWWLYVAIAAFLLLLLGILLPVACAGKQMFTLFAFICAATGGILGFVITWPFPLIQKVYDYLQTFIVGYSVDSINSLGRRIASFALCMGAGVLPLTIWLEFPVFVRAGIVTFGGLFPIGIMFALREAGYPDLAQRLVKRSLLIANFVFGTLAVATMVLVGGIASYTGKFMTGPQFLKEVFDRSVNGAGHVGSWFSGFTLWDLGLLVLLGLVLVLFLTILFGGSKEKGTSDRAVTLLSLLLGVALFLGVLVGVGWGVIAGIRGIGNWFHDDPVPTTTSPQVQPSQKEDGPWFDKTAICANPHTTFEMRRDIPCP